MATPTAMKLAPSQQGRTPAAATPPVSTPFSSQHQHTAFSPLGPRSSPQNVKKSPANSATLMGLSASSSGIPGGSAGPGSNAAVNYDSPAAAAMGTLGVDLGGLDNVSVVGGLAHLGSVLGRSDDDDRARRLQTVLQLLQASKGHVSEAGLERLAKSMGLECLWEEAMGGGGGGGNDARTLVVAGSALALEIAVANNIVESVSVTFPESRSIVLRHVERADKILLHNLQLQPGESPLTKTLDRFAANLETLAVLDKLSVEPGLNLYEAVAGIYETLDRLFQWDLQQLRNDPTLSTHTQSTARDEDALVTTVQCARHGRPTMHEGGHLGLGVDYWKQMRHVRPVRAAAAAAAADNVGVVAGTGAGPDDTTWRILIGCAPTSSALMYPPVRVSDKWLSDAIEKSDNMLLGGNSNPAQPDLDWLEPENTILPSRQQPDGASKTEGDEEAPTTLAGAKLPDVRFHAVFHPPVVLPLALWHQINELVGLVPETDAQPPATFDALLFPVPPGTQHDPSEPRTIRRDKAVASRSDAGGTIATTKHHHALFIYKPVYGRLLSELPFSHPSQVVRMLPTLRQYAFLATVLQNAFGADPEAAAQNANAPQAPAATAPSKTFKVPISGRTKTSTLATADDEFERYAAGGGSTRSAPRPSRALNMDVVLTAHPVPRLQVVFPFRAATADVVLEIGPNAQVHVVSQNLLDDEDGSINSSNVVDGVEGADTAKGKGKGKNRRLYPQDLGRILEVCEDLGVWCEWIRSRCS
ncbi:hypothetical protein HMPREF1624_07468 [Sporothrix schenckii ATCC 58251]|uniref:Mediator of RNA polymerase II transcription subunit 1 n=1 Tax=Sporothrix schenckii (strain ATCC 58251 / de Perez 2211183) TaxID=1391915 RepID=U7PJY3_SPOS1|nr:hypothetical protein HMPREF1624_07468 [Sporothrix schenckii ATCC 58251]